MECPWIRPASYGSNSRGDYYARSSYLEWNPRLSWILEGDTDLKEGVGLGNDIVGYMSITSGAGTYYPSTTTMWMACRIWGKLSEL
jgi:hypothetical protein